MIQNDNILFQNTKKIIFIKKKHKILFGNNLHKNKEYFLIRKVL